MMKKDLTRRSIGFMIVALAIIFYSNLLSASAQEVAVGSATARVLANITVTSTAPLDFGDIFQGIPAAVANNGADAGIFTVIGESGAGISIFIQLPEYVSLSDGSDRMQVIFGDSDASVDTTGAADPTGMGGNMGWQNINPYNIPAATVIGSSGTNIYLGGKVSPSVNQKAGNYSGDIVVTVSYNGS
jgi:hypothetical protein